MEARKKPVKRDWLQRYAAHFDTVEINNTFYGLPPESTFHRWREQAGPGMARRGVACRRAADPHGCAQHAARAICWRSLHGGVRCTLNDASRPAGGTAPPMIEVRKP
jgi:hypothetical protein